MMKCEINHPDGEWFICWVDTFDSGYCLFMLCRYDLERKKWIDLFDNEVSVLEWEPIEKPDNIKLYTGMKMHKYREIYMKAIKRVD